MLADGASVESQWNWIAGTVVNGGFIGVACWYLLTKALPDMQLRYTEALGKQQERADANALATRTAFEKRLDDIAKDSKDELKERRVEYREALKSITDHCERESVRRDQTMQVELAALTKAVENQAMATEELREAVKELRGMWGK